MFHSQILWFQPLLSYRKRNQNRRKSALTSAKLCRLNEL
ncbi:hypothetical protein PSE_p0227 (plasmid) [Pseudovibrio sp. FO-BEG1]|nr:hypothetical protein PSE_p0227 [Pseudovibrio sp. FO-BEG1]